MRLLFDENLSPRLCAGLAGTFPGSASVLTCGLQGETDSEIWRYATENGFIVVSKDSDFVERAIVTGSGPKVIWIRLGNCTTTSVQIVLQNSLSRLEEFSLSDDLVIELP